MTSASTRLALLAAALVFSLPTSAANLSIDEPASKAHFEIDAAHGNLAAASLAGAPALSRCYDESGCRAMTARSATAPTNAMTASSRPGARAGASSSSAATTS